MIEQLINSPKMYKIHSKMFENVQYSYSPSITVLVLAIKLFAVLILVLAIKFFTILILVLAIKFLKILVLILAIKFLRDKVLVLVIGYSYPTLEPRPFLMHRIV